MRNRVLLAAGTLAAFVPTLLLAQQPAQPAQPAKPPAQQPAQRPAAQPAQRPAAQPAQRPAAQPAPHPAAQPVRPLVAGPHLENTWEWTAGVGGFGAGQILSAKSSNQVGAGGTLRIGYNLNQMWNISVGTGLGYSPTVAPWSNTGIATPGADVTWTPNINAKTSPFVLAGVGLLYRKNPSDNNSGAGVQVGVGIRHLLSDAWALRIEAGATVASLTPHGGGSSSSTAGGAVTVGLSYFTGGRKAVASVAVNPRTVTLASLGATQQLTASPMDRGGKPLAGRAVTWTSSNSSVATVSTTGMVTARSNGSATITAASEGATGTVTASVAQTATTLAVAPASATLTAIGQTQQFAVTAKDATNSAMANPSVTWTSSDATVASVNAAGLATAVKNGTARITAATANGRTAITTVTVAQAPASVSVTPSTATISTAGGTAQFAAQTMDANGRPVAGKTFTWTSDAPGVATVSATGLATAVGNGTAQIAAAVEGKTGSAALTVALPVKGVAAPAAPMVELPAANHALVLKNVNFRPNRAELLPAAMPDLDKLALAIKATPNSKWELGGYTSSVGQAARNLRLSQQRADAVKAYLVSKGVPAASLTAVGYGAQHPAASNKTAAGRKQNMRVEIKRLQ